MLIGTAKSLRLLDIRDNRTASSVTIPQPIYGLVPEPIYGIRFAGHYGNTAVTYDRRYLTRPIYELRIPVGTYAFKT